MPSLSADDGAPVRVYRPADWLTAARRRQQALLRYCVAAGRMAEDDRDAVGAMRLLMIAMVLTARSWWNQRYGLLRALFAAGGVSCAEAQCMARANWKQRRRRFRWKLAGRAARGAPHRYRRPVGGAQRRRTTCRFAPRRRHPCKA